MKWVLLLGAVSACSSCISFPGLLPAMPPVTQSAAGASMSFGASIESQGFTGPTLSLDFRYAVNPYFSIGVNLAPGFLLAAGEITPYAAYRWDLDKVDSITVHAGVPLSWALYKPEALRISLGLTYSFKLGIDNYLMFSLGTDPVVVRDKSLDGADEVPMSLAIRDRFPLVIGLEDLALFHTQGTTDVIWANQIVVYHLLMIGLSSGVTISPL